VLTGLAPDKRSGGGTHLPVILLTGIPEPAGSAFARMARLASDQVAHLGMADWQGRYLPVTATPRNGSDGRRVSSQAVLAPATRYCPDCLAGDGSAIQNAFGGPWLKAWHLPVAFACPAHQRLLEHLCPDCGQAIRGRRPGSYSGLLPALLTAGLHPAQCRTVIARGQSGSRHVSCCEARLDRASHRRAASPELVIFQNKILGLLDPDGPASTLSAGLPASPASYFADLRALGILACSTWPAARHLSPSEEAASAIDQHVDVLQRQADDRRAASPGTTSRTKFALQPADAAASGGLAHIADSILAGSPEETRERLRALLPAVTRQAGKSPWARWAAQPSSSCSDGLRSASGPLLRRFTRTSGQAQGRRAAVLGSQRWAPENIPAFLPEDWFARHFTPIPGVSPMLMRRTAVLRLVQMATGGSIGEAACFLGMATAETARPGKGRAYSGTGLVYARTRKQPDPRRFEAEIASLARELNDPATALVNYHHRRQALRNWCIDDGNWTALAGQLPRARKSLPDLGDYKRQIASTYVWVKVTSGEHHFAPRPIEATQPPEIQEAWASQRNTTWSLTQRPCPGPHYTSLKAELDTIADSLARSIDTHRN
jgi:hypothetical protein